jgi:hypothetical protein
MFIVNIPQRIRQFILQKLCEDSSKIFFVSLKADHISKPKLLSELIAEALSFKYASNRRKRIKFFTSDRKAVLDEVNQIPLSYRYIFLFRNIVDKDNEISSF